MNRSTLFVGIILLIAPFIFNCKTELPKQYIPISVWYGPTTSTVYRSDFLNIRQAGFTTCIIDLKKGTLNTDALSFADSIGLRLFLTDENIENYIAGRDSLLYAIDSVTQAYETHPSFQGPLLFDKPGLVDFANLAVLADYFTGKHPNLDYFIQGLPNYASPARLDTANYSDYLSLLARKLKPSILSVEHFGISTEGVTPDFFSNLAAIRKIAIETNRPFWAYALVVPFGEHPAIVHSHIRVQLYSGLAYGAKGVQYFSFLPPERGSYKYGDALLNDGGDRTKTFWDAKSINAEIAQLGPTVMELKSTGVFFSAPIPPAQAGFKPGLAIEKIDAPTMLAGFFQGKDGSEYVLLVNTDVDYGKLANITFADDVESVVEVSKNYMPPEVLHWDKNETEKDANILFRAGDGRLFRIIKK